MRRFLIGLAAAAVGGSAARADMVLTFENTAPKQDLLMLAGGGTFDEPGMPAGVFNFTINSGGAENGFPGSALKSFCTEIFTNVLHNAPTPYAVVPLTSLTDVAAPPSGFADPVNKANFLTELFGRYYAQTDTAEGAAAFQYAVWEVLYDRPGDWSVSGGWLRLFGRSLSDPVAARAQGFLDGLGATADPGVLQQNYPGGEVVGLVSGNFQDQITFREPPAVPAPAGAVLGVVGLAVVAVRRLRRTPAA